MDKITVKAPGRINIIGEHIDYHDGLALPAAIDLYTTMEIHKNGLNHQVTLRAKDLNKKHTYTLSDYHPTHNDNWPNYLMGVTSEIQKRGAQLEGFDATFYSNIPIGAGLSSSAALECSLAYGLNELFELGFELKELAEIAQMAEHNFVGIKCGIMDQYTSLLGKANQALLLDCRSINHTYHDIHLGAYEFLLLNSNISHQLADSEYNKRRSTTELALSKINQINPSIHSFRDISFDQLMQSSSYLSDLEFKRSKHIITEIDRTKKAALALKSNNLTQLGQYMYASHESLQEDYEVTCDETNFLVNLTRDFDYILGSRQMGGGFGGCTINLIKKNKTSDFTDFVKDEYFKYYSKNITPIFVNIGEGVHII